MVEEAQTALQALDQMKTEVSQGKALLDSLNTASGAQALVPELNQLGLDHVLPDPTAYLNAPGHLSDLGGLAQAAQAYREAQRLYRADPSDAKGQSLEAAGDRSARDLAIGQAIATDSQARAESLMALQAALGEAGDVRGVLDLQTRWAGEQARLTNDQIRLQGLQISREAEAALARQRDAERARAASDARLELYRQAF
ncbi:type IV secretion system protein [Phenylobacterium aquaticum]|nr:type IV secretion system protein [Phenylobacterium aquaticum]